MVSISLGPLAFPATPLPVLAALLAAAWLARRTGLGAGEDAAARAESTAWTAAALGLVAARLVHLALHAEAYWETPWACLDIRDGGWHPVSGWLTAAAVLAWGAARTVAIRPALAAAGAAGLMLGLGGQLALQFFQPGGPRASAPALALLSLPRPASVPAGVGPATEATSASLADLVRGQPTVVNLWASWCAPCRAEMPLLAAAQQRYTDVRFLFVNQGEGAAAVNQYLQREALPLRDVWLDTERAVGAAVGSAGLPTTLFYDAQGRLVDAHMGLLNAASLRARLQAMRSD